jgi:hypothetical protein
MRARGLVLFLAACSVPEHDYLLPDTPAPPDAIVDAPAVMLSLSPPDDIALGDVIMGQTSAKAAITVSNDGGGDSGALAIGFDDTSAGFAISDDACSGRPLAAHHTCTFSVALTPSALGAASAGLHVSATPGGTLTKKLSGTAITQGQIDIMEASHDFLALGIDVAQRNATFTIRNLGQSMIGTPMASTASGDPSYVIVSTTCDRPLMQSDTCSVTVAFDPSTVGQKAGALTVTATPGGQDVATLAGTGTAHVKITASGGGGGLVSSTQTGIDCGSTCEADFSSTPVTLIAQPNLGSTFTGWGIDCTAAGTCTLDLTGSKTVTANFDVNHYPLTVAQAGNGTGTLATAVVPAGTSGTPCGPGCTAYPYQTRVTLTPTAATGSSLTGWSGDCSGAGSCTVTLDQVRAVTATFTLDRLGLTVTPDGTGSGTVSGDIGTIHCGSQCSDTYDYGAMVKLTAAPAIGSTFTSWTGCTSTSGLTCSVAMTAARSVTASFALGSYALQVAQTGSGTVNSTDGNIACGTGAGCSHSYAYNAPVALSAAPGIGYHFGHWSGGPCDGSTASNCMFAMPAAMTSTTAVFAINTYALTVTPGGTGTGSVASMPGNISCGAQCTATYDHGTQVTLNATPTGGSSVSWSGCDATDGTSCTVMMTSARTVSVTFSAGPQALTVMLAGNAAGTVSSSPAAISCRPTCNATFAFDQVVTLSVTPQGAATFAGWSGDCSGTTCQLRMNQPHTVTATFSAGDQVLTLDRTGTGDGSFDVSPAPVTSSGNMFTYHFGQPVQITARPNTSSVFTSWSGACAGQGNPCTVTLDQARSATATYTLVTKRLQVAIASPPPNGGSGNVTPNPVGTPCGTRCWDYPFGTAVVLNAAADPGSTFIGWTTCTGTSTCNVTMSADTTVTASFVTNYTLTVTVNGDGQGTVGSTQGGNNGTINCSSGSVGTCAVDYAGVTPPTSVTLSATHDANSVFSGWSGGLCTGSASCTVSMSAARSVTATFTRIYNLTANTTGNGSITQTPAGIGSCGTSCTQYQSGSLIQLTASRGSDSYFIGWTGDCAGQGPTCLLTMSTNRATTANFGALNTLTVNLVGSGNVHSDDGNIDCGANCQHAYAPAPITLTATASTGSVFAGWSGAGCSGTGNCTVTMDMARTVTATFYYDLNLATAGSGSISAQAATGGLPCPPAAGYSQCIAYLPGTVVTVGQQAGLGYSFASWSGGTCSGGGGCAPTMSAPVNVIASFSLNSYPVSVDSTSNNPGPNSITSSPAGISCSSCSASFPYNSQVTLTGNPDQNNGRFIRWDRGPCAGSANPQCTFVVPAAPVSASATFDWFATLQVQMNMGDSGDSGGPTVATQALSSDGTISCANTTTLTGTCANLHYTRNASVSLTYSQISSSWSNCHSRTINGETTLEDLTAGGVGGCAPPSGYIGGTTSQSCTVTFASPGAYVSQYNVWCFIH